MKKQKQKVLYDSINNKLIEISKKNSLKLLILFGSRANGTENDNSDFDFAFISKKLFDTEDHENLRDQIIEILNFEKVDLINIKKEDDVLIKRNIFDTGICIYESEKGLYDSIFVDVIYDYMEYEPMFRIEKEIVENKLKML